MIRQNTYANHGDTEITEDAQRQEWFRRMHPNIGIHPCRTKPSLCVASVFSVSPWLTYVIYEVGP